MARLALIAGPSGSGKSSLLVSWAKTRTAPLAWLDLAPEDADPARFWFDVVAALRRVLPGYEPPVWSLLRSVSAVPHAALVRALLEALPARAHDVIIDKSGGETPAPIAYLVLRGLHRLADSGLVDAVMLLAERGRGRIPVLVSWTTDTHPAPWSGREDVVRLDARTLALDEAEAASLTAAGATLMAPSIGVEGLLKVTGGRIGLLCLAAEVLAAGLAGQRLIDSLPGDETEGDVARVLGALWLDSQPESVQSLLGALSVLGWARPAVVSDVLDDLQVGEVAATLERLHRESAALRAVDVHGDSWVQLHPVVAGVCRTRLGEAGQAALHGRAAVRLAADGDLEEALEHALAAAQVDAAIELIGRCAPAAVERGEWNRVRRWLEALPEESLRTNPWLAVYHGWVLRFAGDVDGSVRRLEQARVALERDDDDQDGTVDTSDALFVDRADVSDGEARKLEVLGAHIAAIGAFHARDRGLMGAAALAEHAAAHLPTEDVFLRALTLENLAALRFLDGDYEGAAAPLRKSAELGRVHGIPEPALSGLWMRAWLHTLRARLGRAVSRTREAVTLATERGWLDTFSGVVSRVSLAAFRLERGHVSAAATLLSSCLATEGASLHPAAAQLGWLVLARARWANGNVDAAWEALDRADAVGKPGSDDGSREGGRVWGPGWSIAPSVGAMRARFWIAEGRLDEAARWVTRSGLAPHDEVTYALEHEYLTLARVRIAQGRADADGTQRLDEAETVLRALLELARAGGRRDRYMEVRMLQSLACYARGEVDAALGSFKEALAYARPGGYVQRFVEEGEPMRTLVREASSRGIRRPHLQRIQAAFDLGR